MQRADSCRPTTSTPGFTTTEAAYKNTNEEYRKQMLASVRSPRLGATEDIAAMVAFLFSDDAAYINGQTILVEARSRFSASSIFPQQTTFSVAIPG